MNVATPLDPLAAAVFAAFGGVVLVAALRRPSDAIVALVATAPFSFTHYLGATTLTFGKVALVAAAIGLFWPRRNRSALPFASRIPAALGLAILLVAAATALSIVVAADRGAASRETFKALQYLATFALAAWAWRLDPDAGRLRNAMLLTVAAVTILALVEEVAGARSGIWYAGKAYPRIAGPLEGPNQLAGYLGIVLPFVAIFALETPTVPALLVGALGVAALVLTLSRSGLVAGIVALAIVLALRRFSAPLCAALAAGTAAAIVVLAGWHVSAIGGRFISFGEVERSGGVGTRSVLWRAAWQLWRAHPMLGVGAGNFELQLGSVAPHGIRTHANSWYLQALVEGGLPLLAATLALVWASIASFRRALRDDLCLAAFAASIAFSLHGIVDLLIFFPKVAVTWFIVLGIAAVQAERTA